MSLPVFEAACVAVIALTLAAMARTRPWRALLTEYAALAVAGWVGEQTCIAFYDFYHYATGWHARVGHVPLLVPLIWPLVIMSARDVAASLGAARRALVVGAIVAFDASLVEVVAVRAGLWSWAEPGHLGVPVVGMLGWGFFAFGAALPRNRLAGAVIAPLVAHALILATWWGLFRWTVRGDLGVASLVGVALVSLAVLGAVLAFRARGGGIPLSVALPRMIAAVLFVALLASTAPASLPLWTHAALVAVPYLVATRFTAGARSAEAPRAARARSR